MNLKTMTATATAAVGLTLTACSGSSEPAPAATAAQTPTVASLDAELHCTGLTQTPSQELYVSGLAKCTINGGTVSIYSFASEQNRMDWVNIASDFSPVVEAGPYVITANDTVTLDTVRTSLS